MKLTWPERTLAAIIGLSALITLALLAADLATGATAVAMGDRLDTLAIDFLFAWCLTLQVRLRAARARAAELEGKARGPLVGTMSFGHRAPVGEVPVVDHVEGLGHPGGGSTD